jgi:hypothetical protein
MDATNTKISICQKALAHIKIAPIVSLSENSEAARKCNLFYDCARKSALRACDWRFATAKRPLVLLGSVDVALANPTDQSKQDIIPPWMYTYAYPAACIRVHKVFNTARGESYPQWQDRTGDDRSTRINKFEMCRAPITGTLALGCNLESAWAEITQDITDESQFDDMFQDALGWALAEELCIPMSCDMELKQSVTEDAKKNMDEAKRKNGGEGVEVAPRYSAYESARDGGDRIF